MDEELTAANATENNVNVDVDNAGDEEVVEFTDGAAKKQEPTAKDTTKAFSERLKKEREKLEKEFAEKKQKEMDSIAVSRGFKDWKELDDYSKQETLKDIGIKDAGKFNEYIDGVIANNPTVLEAKKIIEANVEREQEEILKTAISEINELDPDIKSAEDLINMPNYSDYYNLVSRGYNLTDAYKIIAFDKLTTLKANSAAQSVKNNIDSKSHMKSMTGGASKEVIVPDDVLATYHKNMPNMSEQEIREHYSRFLGGK